MKKNKALRLKTSFRQKITLVLFGVFLFLVLLEGGLRLGGFALLSIQKHRNLQSIKQKSSYRIMCLGESTTQNQYPQFLEQALNQRNVGVRFSVVDKGRAGTKTLAILSQVESYLDEYHPDIIVTMIGINDWGAHIPFEVATTSKIIPLFKSFRTYKLIRLIWLHILTKTKEVGFYKPDKDKQLSGKIQTYLQGIGLKEAYAASVSPEDTLKKALRLNSKNDVALILLGWLYRVQGKFSQAEGLLKKALELNPKNDNAYFELGRLYLNQGKFSQAEESFKKSIYLNPKNVNAYVELGWFYRDYGKFPQAEDLFKRALDLSPKNDNAYFELGRLYREQGKSYQAEDSFRKAIDLNSKNDGAYVELGWFFLDRGKSLQAEESFKKALEINPKNDDADTGLGGIYLEQGKFSQAEDLFKKAIELNPKNDRIFGAMSILYREMGRSELSEEYARKANTVRLEYYAPVTVNNYRKLKEILNKRGIKLVCVQYPMRNVEPLKRIFETDNKGIIFVDNEKTFKNAIKQDGFRTYFRDMFGGDFGHCTEKGNRLLAQNIANAIFKEVLHQ